MRLYHDVHRDLSGFNPAVWAPGVVAHRNPYRVRKDSGDGRGSQRQLEMRHRVPANGPGRRREAPHSASASMVLMGISTSLSRATPRPRQSEMGRERAAAWKFKPGRHSPCACAHRKQWSATAVNRVRRRSTAPGFERASQPEAAAGSEARASCRAWPPAGSRKPCSATHTVLRC